MFNSEMIRYLLLQNRQGKTRLSKWYMPVEFEEQSRLENEIHKLVSSRDSKVTNFIEFSTYKLITRRYAGLFFTVAVDSEDNELLTLETIHFLVETMDAYFKSVSEMDIIFYFYKVYGDSGQLHCCWERCSMSTRPTLLIVSRNLRSLINAVLYGLPLLRSCVCSIIVPWLCVCLPTGLSIGV